MNAKGLAKNECEGGIEQHQKEFAKNCQILDAFFRLGKDLGTLASTSAEYKQRINECKTLDLATYDPDSKDAIKNGSNHHLSFLIAEIHTSHLTPLAISNIRLLPSRALPKDVAYLKNIVKYLANALSKTNSSEEGEQIYNILTSFLCRSVDGCRTGAVLSLQIKTDIEHLIKFSTDIKSSYANATSPTDKINCFKGMASLYQQLFSAPSDSALALSSRVIAATPHRLEAASITHPVAGLTINSQNQLSLAELKQVVEKQNAELTELEAGVRKIELQNQELQKSIKDYEEEIAKLQLELKKQGMSSEEMAQLQLELKEQNTFSGELAALTGISPINPGFYPPSLRGMVFYPIQKSVAPLPEKVRKKIARRRDYDPGKGKQNLFRGCFNRGRYSFSLSSTTDLHRSLSMPDIKSAALEQLPVLTAADYNELLEKTNAIANPVVRHLIQDYIKYQQRQSFASVSSVSPPPRIKINLSLLKEIFDSDGAENVIGRFNTELCAKDLKRKTIEVVLSDLFGVEIKLRKKPKKVLLGLIRAISAPGYFSDIQNDSLKLCLTGFASREAKDTDANLNLDSGNFAKAVFDINSALEVIGSITVAPGLKEFASALEIDSSSGENLHEMSQASAKYAAYAEYCKKALEPQIANALKAIRSLGFTDRGLAEEIKNILYTQSKSFQQGLALLMDKISENHAQMLKLFSEIEAKEDQYQRESKDTIELYQTDDWKKEPFGFGVAMERHDARMQGLLGHNLDLANNALQAGTKLQALYVTYQNFLRDHFPRQYLPESLKKNITLIDKMFEEIEGLKNKFFATQIQATANEFGRSACIARAPIRPLDALRNNSGFFDPKNAHSILSICTHFGNIEPHYSIGERLAEIKLSASASSEADRIAAALIKIGEIFAQCCKSLNAGTTPDAIDNAMKEFIGNLCGLISTPESDLLPNLYNYFDRVLKIIGYKIIADKLWNRFIKNLHGRRLETTEEQIRSNVETGMPDFLSNKFGAEPNRTRFLLLITQFKFLKEYALQKKIALQSQARDFVSDRALPTTPESSFDDKLIPVKVVAKPGDSAAIAASIALFLKSRAQQQSSNSSQAASSSAIVATSSEGANQHQPASISSSLLSSAITPPSASEAKRSERKSASDVKTDRHSERHVAIIENTAAATTIAAAATTESPGIFAPSVVAPLPVLAITISPPQSHANPLVSQSTSNAAVSASLEQKEQLLSPAPSKLRTRPQGRLSRSASQTNLKDAQAKKTLELLLGQLQRIRSPIFQTMLARYQRYMRQELRPVLVDPAALKDDFKKSIRTKKKLLARDNLAASTIHPKNKPTIFAIYWPPGLEQKDLEKLVAKINRQDLGKAEAKDITNMFGKLGVIFHNTQVLECKEGEEKKYALYAPGQLIKSDRLIGNVDPNDLTSLKDLLYWSLSCVALHPCREQMYFLNFIANLSNENQKDYKDSNYNDAQSNTADWLDLANTLIAALASSIENLQPDVGLLQQLTNAIKDYSDYAAIRTDFEDKLDLAYTAGSRNLNTRKLAQVLYVLGIPKPIEIRGGRVVPGAVSEKAITWAILYPKFSEHLLTCFRAEVEPLDLAVFGEGDSNQLLRKFTTFTEENLIPNFALRLDALKNKNKEDPLDEKCISEVEAIKNIFGNRYKDFLRYKEAIDRANSLITKLTELEHALLYLPAEFQILRNKCERIIKSLNSDARISFFKMLSDFNKLEDATTKEERYCVVTKNLTDTLAKLVDSAGSADIYRLRDRPQVRSNFAEFKDIAEKHSKMLTAATDKKSLNSAWASFEGEIALFDRDWRLGWKTLLNQFASFFQMLEVNADKERLEKKKQELEESKPALSLSKSHKGRLAFQQDRMPSLTSMLDNYRQYTECHQIPVFLQQYSKEHNVNVHTVFVKYQELRALYKSKLHAYSCGQIASQSAFVSSGSSAAASSAVVSSVVSREAEEAKHVLQPSSSSLLAVTTVPSVPLPSRLNINSSALPSPRLPPPLPRALTAVPKGLQLGSSNPPRVPLLSPPPETEHGHRKSFRDRSVVPASPSFWSGRGAPPPPLPQQAASAAPLNPNPSHDGSAAATTSMSNGKN